MALFQWTKEYSVGVGNMDRHHQKIFDMLNKLHNAMKQGKGGGLIPGIIKELLDYTRYHFGEEEMLMEQVRYSELDAQKNAHKKFISDIEGYKEKADSGMAAFLSPDISVFLTDWLKNHIAIMDKKYQDDMNANGIR